MSQLSRLRAFAAAANPIYTSLAHGYANKPSSFVGDVIFPVVEVDDIALKLPRYGADSMRLFATERASGAKSNIIIPSAIGMDDVRLEEHDLSYPLDWLEESAAKKWFNLQKHAISVLVNAMRLKREHVVAALVQNVDVYPVGNVLALSGTSKWTHADSDPIKNISDAVEKIDSDNANRLILGAGAFRALQNHPKIKAAMSYQHTGVQNDATVTEEHLSRIFNIPVVRRAKSRWLNPATNEKSYVWNDDIAIVAYVNPGSSSQANPFEPSFGYSLVLSGFPVPDDWQSEDKKVKYQRVTTVMKHPLVDNTCGYLITGCV